MDIFDDDSARHVTRTSIAHGANWFFWIAILSVVNTLIVFYYNLPNMPIALGITQWLDGTPGFSRTGVAMTTSWLVTDLLIAGVVAIFGLLARKGSDVAFVVGIFLYVVDAMLAVGLRDFFALGVHLVAIFFLFKGLLASRHIRENAVSI